MSQDVTKTTFQGKTRSQIKRLAKALGVTVYKSQDATKLAEAVLKSMAEDAGAYDGLSDDLKELAEAIGYEALDEEEADDEVDDADDTADAASSSGLPSHLLNANELKKALANQQAAQATGNVPRLFIKDGQTKTVRFRDNTQITGIYYHSLKIEGRWRYYVCSEGTEIPDDRPVRCAFCAAGIGRSVRAVYEVIDREEWEDKQGVKHCHTPRLFEVTQKLHMNIQHIAKKGMLTDRDVEITRNGVQQAQYIVLPDPEPTPEIPEGVEVPPRLRDKLADFYKPLTKVEQQAAIAQSGVSGNVAEQEDV